MLYRLQKQLVSIGQQADNAVVGRFKAKLLHGPYAGRICEITSVCVEHHGVYVFVDVPRRDGRGVLDSYSRKDGRIGYLIESVELIKRKQPKTEGPRLATGGRVVALSGRGG